jgi:GGDEF domain-containing protein
VGGDEFIVVAVGLSKRDVRARMHAFKKEFEKYPWELDLIDKEEGTNEAGSSSYEFSFSFNVLQIEDPEQFEKLMHKADANVLQQKRDRRHGTGDI